MQHACLWITQVDGPQIERLRNLSESCVLLRTPLPGEFFEPSFTWELKRDVGPHGGTSHAALTTA